eukprot:15481788-Alexandrium_andersonii.AAC.1
MAEDRADCGWEGCGVEPVASPFRSFRPLTPRCCRRIRNLRQKQRRSHHSGASRTNFEAVDGLAQFTLR